MATSPPAKKEQGKKKEENNQNEAVSAEKGGFFSSALGKFVLVGIPLLFALFASLSYNIKLYFDNQAEVRQLNKKLVAAVLLACKVNYKDDPDAVTFAEEKNEKGKRVTVLKCEPEKD